MTSQRLSRCNHQTVSAGALWIKKPIARSRRRRCVIGCSMRNWRCNSCEANADARGSGIGSEERSAGLELLPMCCCAPRDAEKVRFGTGSGRFDVSSQCQSVPVSARAGSTAARFRPPRRNTADGCRRRRAAQGCALAWARPEWSASPCQTAADVMSC